MSHFGAQFSLKKVQIVLYNLMLYKQKRLKFFYQLGLDFRFGDRPEVDTRNHVAGVSRTLEIQFLDAVFEGESDETRNKFERA